MNETPDPLLAARANLEMAEVSEGIRLQPEDEALFERSFELVPNDHEVADLLRQLATAGFEDEPHPTFVAWADACEAAVHAANTPIAQISFELRRCAVYLAAGPLMSEFAAKAGEDALTLAEYELDDAGYEHVQTLLIRKIEHSLANTTSDLPPTATTS